MYGDETFQDDGDARFAGGVGSPDRTAQAGSSIQSPSSSVVCSEQTTPGGQKIMQGSFQLQKWYDGPGLKAIDTNNQKGYPVTLVAVPVDSKDKDGVKTSKNQCADRVPEEYRVKGVDTFGTYASVKHNANVREVGSIGQIRMLSEKAFPYAYPVQSTPPLQPLMAQ